MKLQFKAGSDVAIVTIKGNPKSPEPAHVRIAFPGGDVEVVRATDGENADYWVHLRVNRPSDGSHIPDETETAKIIDARVDSHNSGVASQVEFENPETYHVAFRVKRNA